ncbi:hypothetical protein H5P28_14020 [Ruficoccus amylovorans]|uniref:SLA1 homology domain-containing protein n=1 Tax=Ruficoccus amylovorans TaxID=1804625 RepID=A0A842HGS4_9BACT|nr:hypothetical protein [Ruficoccus amylovorans]MBC2595380.1 hypothetical protein [Ruficoccus amylovorans]
MDRSLCRKRALLVKSLCMSFFLPLWADGANEHVWEVWTNKEGQRISAELVQQEKDGVELIREADGVRFRLKLDELDKQDQEYLEKRWDALEKRAKGAEALREKFPAPLRRDIYRLESNTFSFNAPKKGETPYKTLEVTGDGFYARFERNFRFVTGEAFDSQLDNIKNAIAKELKRENDKAGGTTLMALQSQLNAEWLEKSLKPYYEEWRKLQKETALPEKPKPAEPKAAETKPGKPAESAKPAAPTEATGKDQAATPASGTSAPTPASTATPDATPAAEKTKPAPAGKAAAKAEGSQEGEKPKEGA